MAARVFASLAIACLGGVLLVATPARADYTGPFTDGGIYCMNVETVAAEFAISELIVVGKLEFNHVVRDPEDPEGYIETIYDVEVHDSLKGDAPAVVQVSDINASGRFGPDVGVAYLLFIKKAADGSLFIHRCTHSAPARASAEAIAEVRRIAAAAAPPSAR